MGGKLILPGRYYCRWPYDKPKGLCYEEQVLELDSTAFFLVDVYGKGFDDPYGDVPRYPPYYSSELFCSQREIIRNKIRPCLDEARRTGMKIVYTTNYWRRMNWDYSEFGLMTYRTETGCSGTLEALFAGESDYVAWSEIVRPQQNDNVANKTMFSAFFETNLDTLLRNAAIKSLICVGFYADICLLNTVIEAMYRNYRVIVLRDCTSGFEFEDTKEEMQMTWFGIRYIEANVGFTATAQEFMAGCEKARS
jgi:nicotinamidase-related amidase